MDKTKRIRSLSSGLITIAVDLVPNRDSRASCGLRNNTSQQRTPHRYFTSERIVMRASRRTQVRAVSETTLHVSSEMHLDKHVCKRPRRNAAGNKSPPLQLDGKKKEDDMENKRTRRNSEIIQWHVDTVRRAATQPFRPHAHPAEGPPAMWRLAAWPQFTSVVAKIYDSPGGLAWP